MYLYNFILFDWNNKDTKYTKNKITKIRMCLKTIYYKIVLFLFFKIFKPC